MRIYLASSFDLVPEVSLVAEYLEKRGHTITVKWWAKDGFGVYSKETHRESCTDVLPREFYARPRVAEIYKRDTDGIRICDVFVLVSDQKPRKFNGANVECGIAQALGKPCFSVGALENSALYLPLIKCATVAELGAALDVLKRGGIVHCPGCQKEMEKAQAVGSSPVLWWHCSECKIYLLRVALDNPMGARGQ